MLRIVRAAHPSGREDPIVMKVLIADKFEDRGVVDLREADIDVELDPQLQGAKHIDPKRDVTDYYKAVIEYPGGIVLDWLHNWLSPYRDKGAFSRNYRQVAGTKGAIDIDSGRIFPKTPNGRIGRVKPLGHDPSLESFTTFVDAVRNKKKPVSGVYNGRDAVLVGLLVRTAVDTKRTVTMEEILAQG